MQNPDLLPCPVCGVVIGNPESVKGRTGIAGDSMLTTPLARLYAVATETDITVLDLSTEEASGLGGAVALGFDDQGNVLRLVFLANDLTDELRADVLAFSMSVIAADKDRVRDTPHRYMGIGRQPLPPATKGPGHIAWHMLRTCGRESSSATFEVVDI